VRAPADFSADLGAARSCTGAGAGGGHQPVGPGGPGGPVQRQGDQGGGGGDDAYWYFNLLGAFQVIIEGWGAYIDRSLLHLVIRPPDICPYVQKSVPPGTLSKNLKMDLDFALNRAIGPKIRGFSTK